MMKNRFVFAVVFIFGFALAASAGERIGVGYAMVDDGTCSRNQNTLTAEYDREDEGDGLEVRGRVRAEPSGGDCRVEAISYDVFAARYFELGSGLDAFVEFGANEQSSAAVYALTDGMGNLLLRDDGNALFTTNLPAGSAKTIIGVLGLSKDFGPVRVGAGGNLVPVDWANHEPGRTLHLTAGFDLGDIDLDSSIDLGASHFGEVSGTYRKGFGTSPMDVGIGVSYYWGIRQIDNGAPLTQSVSGSWFARAGPPRNDALVVSLTVGFSLK